jgi:WD40 repeat protein
MRTLLSLALIFAVASGCRTLKNEVDVNALLASRGDEAYLAGPVRGLGAPVVHNRKDFIYGFAFDRSGQEIAYTHHVTTHMELSLGRTGEAAPRVTKQVNPSEFDLEGVVFVEGRESRAVVVASRQGTLRRYTLAGELEKELSYGVALTRAAVNPAQTLIAVGTADGRVVLFDASSLAFRGEAKAHEAEVRGVVFLNNQRLATVGFDGALVVHSVEPGGEAAARVAATDVGQGMRVFLAHISGERAIPTARDVRQPMSVISSAAVERLKLATVAGETGSVLTPVGVQPRPLVDVGDLQVRYLALGQMRAAVCDECVPPGAELVLGQDVLARAVFGDDVATSEVMVKGLEEAPEGVVPAQRIPGALAVLEKRRVKLPGPGTDIDKPRRGPVLATYSHAKAERSPEVYDQEKEGRLPPAGPGSGAVLVDVDTGELGRRFIAHRGFTFTGAISPDGATVATGGWDDRVVVFDAATGAVIDEEDLGWLARQVRFSRDGRFLGVAAWTKVNPTNDGSSDPAMFVFPVVFDGPEAKSGAKAVSSAADGIP